MAVAAVVATAGLALLRSAPPPPLGRDAPPEAFSAARAGDVLARVLAGVGPHPVGSPAGGLVRARLLAELHRLGLEPELQETFSCSAYGSCARVVNVLALVPGRAPGKAVALASHYDSVGAGPGASDDGVGLASALEVARALRAGPPPPRPVLLVVTDGEEAGLLGAQAFVRHPRARQVAAVVNLEARGTSGRSLLFEVKNAPALAARVARALPRPGTSSLFAAIYDRLPNDTDLSVLGRLGVPGLNLAFIGDVTRYHTPLDDLAHVEPATLQHQGENALALVRALAAAPDLESPPAGRTVWFDVLSATVVAWPERASLALALAALVPAAVAVSTARRRGARWVPLGAAGILPLAAAGAAAGIAAALQWAVSRAGALPTSFVADPTPLVVAGCSAGVTSALALSALLPRRTAAQAALAGCGAGLAVVAVALAIALPAASHLAIVPACATAWAAAAGGPWPRAARAGAAAAAVAAALLLAPLCFQLPLALGAGGVRLTAALAGLAVAPLAALVVALRPRARVAAVLLALAAAVALAAVQARTPPFTADAPRRLPIVHLEDADRGTAVALLPSDAGPPPPAIAALAVFRRAGPTSFLWALGAPWAADVPPVRAAPPAVEVLETRSEGAQRVLRLRLRPSRDGATLALSFPPGAPLLEARVEGERVEWTSKVERLAAGRWVAVLQAPRAGAEVLLSLGGEVEATVVEASPGLPPGTAPLAAARPRWAATSQDGDATVVVRRQRL